MLPTQYLLQKLEETTLALKEYETQVAPTGWTFVWDSDFERYYYYNAVTDKASWDFPSDDVIEGGAIGQGREASEEQTPIKMQKNVHSSHSRETTPPPGI